MKIGQYLAKIWTKSIVSPFFDSRCTCRRDIWIWLWHIDTTFVIVHCVVNCWGWAPSVCCFKPSGYL